MIKCLDGTIYKEYNDYIKSIHWQNKKLEYFRFHDKRCMECGNHKSIQLHHLTYEHIGNERLSELIPLCEMCHKSIHAVDNVVKKELSPKKKTKTKNNKKVKCQNCRYFEYGYYCKIKNKTASYYTKFKYCNCYKQAKQYNTLHNPK